jgi:hypothetical protein
MDVISYGVANKAAKQEKTTRTDVLGSGVEGTFPHTKNRIDSLENALQGVVSQSDKLIVNDAVNIMKAHAKLNSVAKTMRYKMQNMVFDDLLDLSGVDTTNSSGYTHDAVNGLIKSSGGEYVVEAKTEVADAVPSKAILTVEEAVSSFVKVSPSNMTGLNTPAPYRISSYSYTSSGIEPWRIFDGTSSIWQVWNITKPVGGHYFSIDLGTPKKVSKISIKPMDYGSNAALVRTVEIYGSVDNVTFNKLDTHIFENNHTKKERVFDNTSLYRYYRFNFIDSYISTAGNYIAVEEMELFEESAISSLKGTYSISRDDGAIWSPITPDTLFYFNDNIGMAEKNLKVKVTLPADTQLLNYALTWA